MIVVKWMEFVFLGVFIMFFLGMVSGMFSINEKTSSNLEVYECGIESIIEEKTPFYLHFFLVGILFLLFDVELIVCIPMVMMCVYAKMWSVIWFFFFLILFFGLVLEIMMETVSWKE